MKLYAKHIRRLANGHFEVRLWRSGKLIKARFATRVQAEYFRDEMILDATMRRHGLPGMVHLPPQLLKVLADFLEAADKRGVAFSTLTHYLCSVNAVRAWIERELRRPKLLAQDVDNAMVHAYIRWRCSTRVSPKAHRPASEAQAARDLVILKMAYRLAQLPRTWTIPRILRRGRGKRVLEPEQLVAFLEALPAGSLARTVAEVHASTGMRPVDVRELRCESIDLEARVISFTARKTKKEQTLPISRTLALHLAAWCAEHPPWPGALVFTIDGRALQKTSLSRHWRRASVAAGISPPIAHIGCLRNGLIGYLLARGEDPYLVMLLAGHSDIRTTLGYARNQQRVAEKLRPLAEAVDEARTGR